MGENKRAESLRFRRKLFYAYLPTGLFQTPSIEISITMKGERLSCCIRRQGREAGTAADEKRRTHIARQTAHRQAPQGRTRAAGTHRHVAGPSGALHAREPLQGFPRPMDSDAPALFHQQGAGPRFLQRLFAAAEGGRITVIAFATLFSI